MKQRLGTCSGMSLVELLISLTIYPIIIIAVFQFVMVSQKLYLHSTIKDDLRKQAEKALHGIIEEFQDITEDSIISPVLVPSSPPVDRMFIRYAKVTGVDATGKRLYSNEHYSLGFELIEGEIDDGIDNNKNGLIDEGWIIMRKYGQENVPGSGYNELDNEGRFIRVVAHNVMRRHNPGEGELNGFSISFQPDDPASPSKWILRVSISLEKKDPTRIFEDAQSHKRYTTRVYYKTTTISLAK